LVPFQLARLPELPILRQHATQLGLCRPGELTQAAITALHDLLCVEGGLDSLAAWKLSLAEVVELLAQQATPEQQRETGQPAPRKNRSTGKGDAKVKIISALTKHHEYANGSCLNQEPIGVRDLAGKDKADVGRSTVSDFFGAEFGGHTKYREVFCRDVHLLVAALKKLNDEYTVDNLFGGTPPSERRDDD
jgi:hypothetical protein